MLIETTDLPFGDVAFAAGFSSIRQFNDTVRAVCDLTPTALRQRARTRLGRTDGGAAGALSLRLPVRTPFAYEGLFGHLAASAVPGVEEVRDGAYRRTLRLPNGNGIVSLTPQPDHVQCQLVLDDFRDLSTAIARCRRLLDLDADPEAVVDALGADPDLAAAGGQGARSAASRAPSTSPSSPCAWCWASRCRSRPPAPTPRASSPPTASRWPTSTAVSPTSFRRSSTSPRSTRHTWHFRSRGSDR